MFGDAFVENTAFDHDTQRLIAVRRRTMFMRRIDGVRRVEVICVMQGLCKQMAVDGACMLAAGTYG